MQDDQPVHLVVTQQHIESAFLNRTVTVDFYIPNNIDAANLCLLLINDGQDLQQMNFTHMLQTLLQQNKIEPLICVGLHASHDRKMEYGTAKVLDYEGRGAKAHAHQQFVLNEVLPYLQQTYGYGHFKKFGYAGFSLGGLHALDAVWNYPQIFNLAGVFSGSLWWRSKGLDEGYNEDVDRIMHQQIREGVYQKGLQFYFTTGSLDETADRNNNGIIDSIDDTVALIGELKKLGYDDAAVVYKNYEDGRHDVATWGRAMEPFLLWAFKKVTVANEETESC